MLGIMAFPSLLYSALCFLIPESPRWLIARKHDRAHGVEVLRLIQPEASAAELDALGAASWSAQGCALRDPIASRGDAITEELLSPAERRVAEAVASGMSNREVAASLYVSERTVEFHLHNVYRKLKVRSRTQLVRLLPPR